MGKKGRRNLRNYVENLYVLCFNYVYNSIDFRVE